MLVWECKWEKDNEKKWCCLVVVIGFNIFVCGLSGWYSWCVIDESKCEAPHIDITSWWATSEYIKKIRPFDVIANRVAIEDIWMNAYYTIYATHPLLEKMTSGLCCLDLGLPHILFKCCRHRIYSECVCWMVLKWVFPWPSNTTFGFFIIFFG